MHDGLVGLLVGRHSVPATTSWWDHLWPLLLTALLSLLIFWFVQQFLVPHFEARKRREERWEEDVLEVGRLLTFEFSDAMDRLRSELYVESMREYEMPDHVPEDRREELRHEQRERVVKARDTYRSVGQKVSWLTDRVVSLDRDSLTLGRFNVKQMALEVRGLDNIAPIFQGSDEPIPTMDEINTAVEVARTDLKNLVDSVKQLASGPPPRPRSIFGRVGSRVRRLKRKFKS